MPTPRQAVDTTKFGEFATKFKNADPHVYEQFLRLLDQYVQEVTVAVTQATTAEILVAQGLVSQPLRHAPRLEIAPKVLAHADQCEKHCGTGRPEHEPAIV